MTDTKTAWLTFAASVLMSVGIAGMSYGAQAQQVDNQQRDIDRLEKAQAAIDAKLDLLLTGQAAILGRLEESDRLDAKERRDRR